MSIVFCIRDQMFPSTSSKPIAEFLNIAARIFRIHVHNLRL